MPLASGFHHTAADHHPPTVKEMGEQAARAVLSIINGEDLVSEPVVCELVERESVARSNG